MFKFSLSRPVAGTETSVVAAPKTRQGVLTRLAHDKRGSTAMVLALIIYPVLMLVGMSVDFGRSMSVKARMQTIMDAASLAGARAAQTLGSTNPSASLASLTAAANTAATAYFNSMVIPGTLSQRMETPVANSSATEFTFTGTAWVKTPFLNAGSLITTAAPVTDSNRPSACDRSWFSCQKVQSTAAALISSGGNNTGYNLEISMMLDVTGSMSGQKLTDLKSAATDAVNIMVWADQSTFKSRVAIVPFAEDVRLPTQSAFAQAAGGNHNGASATVSGFTFTKPNNQHCVVERMGSDKYTDAEPKNGSWVTRELVYSGWSQDCDVPSNAAIQPLTNDKTVLTNLIDGLSTAGGTAGHIGTAWAWYTLAPNFNGLWGNDNKAADYDNSTTPTVKKIAILMTDGEYNTQYDVNGIRTSVLNPNLAKANDTSAKQAEALCAAMKAKGVEVYTVGFNVNDSAKILLRDKCATDTSHFYDATDGDKLKLAFRDIALKVSTLRLSQ